MKDFIPSPTADKKMLENFNHNFDGFDCPTCKRMVQIYKRTLHKSIILQLVNLLNAGGDKKYIHSDKFITGTVGKDFAISKHWDLIVQEPTEDRRRKTSGKWKLTPLGVDFLLSRSAIHKYTYLFNDKIIGTSESVVFIKDCLGKTFDYSKIHPQFPLFELKAC